MNENEIGNESAELFQPIPIPNSPTSTILKDDQVVRMTENPTLKIKTDIQNAIKANSNVRLSWDSIEKFLKDAGYKEDEINDQRLKALKFAPYLFKSSSIDNKVK
jgi:hypothetical protein